MMEGVAMLRQLIGQLQEVLELYGSPPPAAVPSNYFLHFQPRPQQHLLRCCFFNLDGSSLEGGCYNLSMTAGKSENLKMMEPGKPPPTKRSRKERNRGKATAMTSSSGSMEETIWKEFPEDLFEVVIARLPIETFFRFRSVCQKWNSLLTSQSFSYQCTQVEQAQPWFYTITHENVNTGAMYDPLAKKWHHPTVPALPTKLIVLPVASAGGLVCFLDIGHRSFYICNPLTRSFKELPARSVKVWSRVAVGMTLNGRCADSGYKIIWVGCLGEYEVYDSTKNRWSRPGRMPSNIKLPLSLNFRSQAVAVDRTLYFMRSDPEGLVSYNMDTGIWKQFLIPGPPHLSDHTLAECGGRIMLVGLLTKNAATCVCIWELQKMTLLWKEVDRMPNIWCLEFYGKHVRMTCLGNKGLLMLSLRSRQMNRLVSYDLSSKEWLKVPGCVLPRGRKKQWIACGTAFHPCLTALA
ncbi:F-box only protein 6-like [Dorcoceras hygrometricum]|uniref:F-box only protein 6-like n=1 Tax=Dorcoceras hygrometricum TaxID=472368 RepID=A0A2Z7B326_9LAMI|nr:F-box only protein 6-like [Dorcoceras hygrometricum]